jgi:arylsulfatase A-like enzyme
MTKIKRNGCEMKKILLGVGIVLSGQLAQVNAAANRPNVLFIFTDDQRHNTIAALGNPHIITPNLDRLAKRSFVFRNAYNFGGNVGAVCIPARNMAMTGKTFSASMPSNATKASDRPSRKTSRQPDTKPSTAKRVAAPTYRTSVRSSTTTATSIWSTS